MKFKKIDMGSFTCYVINGGGVGGVVAWPMAHNRKVVGSSLVSAQLIPSPLAVIKANAGPLYMTT